MKKLLLTFAAFATLTGVASAQEVPERNPTVTYLMEQYGISEDDAQSRIDLQLDIADMAQSIIDRSIPGYIGLYIQHEPNFKIEVLFQKDLADGKFNKNTLIKELSNQQKKRLRPHVRVRKIKRSSDSIENDTQVLSSLFGNENISFIGGFNFETLKYTFKVSSQAEKDTIVGQIPADLQDDVVINVGVVPTRENVTGALPGDTIRGGEALRTSPSLAFGADCTLGYAVNYTKLGVIRQGILTAGHCADTLFYNVNGHFVRLDPPFVIERDAVAKYDYQVWDVTGLPTNYSISYQDLNGIPEFPAFGTLDLVGIRSFNNQFKGMVVCKSGARTGITCGQIIDGNAVLDGFSGFIEVGLTQQAVISLGGDSGSPWFLYPGFSRDIIGVGIHTAGDAIPGPTGTAVYMPIDYIND